jgi:hypothetical protein
MVPNDINIITQAFSELSRAKALISSAEARLTSALNSTGEKTYSQNSPKSRSPKNKKD